MSVELENLSLKGIPDLKLAYCKFLSSMPINDKNEHFVTLMKGIEMNNMAPWYKHICFSMKWNFNSALYEKMMLVNKEKIQALDDAIDDAKKHFGAMEVRIAYLDKAEYYSSIGDKEKAVSIFSKSLEKTASSGQKFNILFHLLRIGFFFMDFKLITENIKKAHKLIEKAGNWDNINKLKIYEGLYYIAVKDFKKASNLLLDSFSTFTAYELIDYKTFVCYAIYSSIISVSRNKLHDNVIKNPEILQALEQNTVVKDLLFSFYNCKYIELFSSLAEIENFLRHDYYFHSHCDFFIRELKIYTYNQLLISYKTLSLQFLANTFCVTSENIESDLSKFIAIGRLNCKIDKVNETIETQFSNVKKSHYNLIVKQGDLLLTRIQKLSRVISI